MKIVYQGLESNTHRDTLLSALPADGKDRAMGMISYRSLRSRRLGASYVRDTASQIPVVLESGAGKASLTKEQAADLADEYYRFLDEVDEVEYAVEFTHPSLSEPTPGSARIVREHQDQDDIDGLEHLLDRYGDVAMAYDGHKSRIAAVLRRRGPVDHFYLATGHGDLEEVRRTGFTAMATGVWLAPGRFGEMSLWDGSKFHRANSKARGDLLKRYEVKVESYGFDLGLLHDGDTREMQRLSAYSLTKWSMSLPDAPAAEASDTTSGTVVARTENRSEASITTVPVPRPQRNLPGFQWTESTSMEQSPDGGSVLRTSVGIRPDHEMIRKCDSCFLAANCPAFEAGSSCAFRFPVEVQTDAQMRLLMNGMVELQATRVAFARFAEEVNGGYPDPVVGEEMDRLVRMGERVQRMSERREKLVVSLESESSGGGTGVLSRIFGGAPKPPDPPAARITGAVVPGELSDR